MSTLNVTSIKGRAGAIPNLPDGAIVSGIATIGAGGIDVTGVVTATSLESDTKISAGSSITATSFYGDGANITGLPEASVVTGIASGAIPANRALCIHSDGKVGVVTGTKAVWNSRQVVDGSVNLTSSGYSIAYNGTVLLAHWANTSGHGQLKVGTYSGSGNSITWGATVQYATNVSQFDLVYDSNADRFVIFYRNSSSIGKAAVVTVSGTTPTKQTEVDFKNPSGTIEAIDVAYDPDSGQFGLVYKEGSTNNCHVRLGKASGNTVTFGSEVTYAGGNSNGPVTICYDTTRNKFILAAGYNGDQSNNGWGFVGTVSGTSITVTSAGLIKYNYQNKIKMIHDPFRDRYVFVGYNNNNTQWDSLTGTYVSDTEITWNDNGVLQDVGTTDRGIGLVYNPFGKNYVVAYPTASPNQVKYKVGRLGGLGTPEADTITWSNEKTVNGSNAGGTIGAMSTEDSIILFYGYGSPLYTQVQIQELQNSTLTDGSENFVGYSAGTYTDGQTATIKIVGNTVDVYSNLSPGVQYYIQGDGGIAPLSTVESYPSTYNLTGVSLSSSKLLIK